MSNMKGGGASDALDEDDYVAKLLSQDARNCSKRYSTLGTDAFIPPVSRPKSGAPKPNTRFLKNILRDTDNHNANLKRKEEEEARQRMRELRGGKTSRSRSERSRHHDEREAKRRRIEEPDADRHRSRSDRHERSSREHRHRRERDYRSESEDREGPSSARRHMDSDRSHRYSSRSTKHEGRSRDRYRSPGDDRHRRHKHRRRSRSRSRSPRGRRREDVLDDSGGRRKSTSLEKVTDEISSRRHSCSPVNAPHKSVDNGEEPDSGSDSDPLSNLIGPLPPSANKMPSVVKSRGRGAYKSSSSNMDAHFSASYDPSLDVHLEDSGEDTDKKKSARRPVAGLATEDDDWDMALEALRDRALWKRKGAERLREAGFADDVVERWSSQGAFPGTAGSAERAREEDIQDVKWAKKGEGREWDRGKVVDEDGHVNLRAAW